MVELIIGAWHQHYI